MPTPIIGLPLPRAADAYVTSDKWTNWVLSERGHGQEWARVFRVDIDDSEQIWRAVADDALKAPVSSIRRVNVGVTCSVPMTLTINDRTARVRTIWHYAYSQAAPRLVTAFPTT
jgi:Domain of unknown function (DUF6883)